jgi:glucose-6-phosphate isomerase
LEYLNPETTFFIIASKSFTTQDTMVNADTARQWYINKMGSDEYIHRHFSAVTSNVKLAKEYGIEEDNIFKMWDWVCGRYSLWSAIGLSIVIAIGPEQFFVAVIRSGQLLGYQLSLQLAPNSLMSYSMGHMK